MSTYQCSKTYSHNLGWSVCFRQWRAKDSHCQYLHGYALSFKLTFEATDLDYRNWVVNFGGLKDLKQELEFWFDHTTVVADDDPNMDWFREAEKREIITLRVIPFVGCEGFAQFAYELAYAWMVKHGLIPRVQLISVEVKEHDSNSATYFGKK